MKWRVIGIVQVQNTTSTAGWSEHPIFTTVQAISADEALASILRFYGSTARWYNPPTVFQVDRRLAFEVSR